MRWFDRPRSWWIYRWLHHFWVLSFNRNPHLYRVVWWSQYTRPIFYNTKGRLRSSGFLWFGLIWLILIFGIAQLFIFFSAILGGR